MLAHHLPITKTSQNQEVLLTPIFFEIRHHIAIKDVEAPVRELLPPLSLPLSPLDDVTFACNILSSIFFGCADMSKLTSQVN